MKVVILCGGYGTRIRDVDSDIPKPMIKIGKFPILIHVMNIYSNYNYKEFILCTGYKSDLIKQFFLNFKFIVNDFEINLENNQISFLSRDKKNLDWKIKIVDTGLDTNTGSRINKIKKYINEDNFFLTYGDGVGNVNIKKLFQFHLKNKKIVTVTGVKAPGRFGELNVDSRKVVRTFNEKTNNNSGLINGGFFVCNKKIFNFFEKNKNFSFEFNTLDKISKKRQLVAYAHKGFWHPMDTSRDYNYLNMLASHSLPPWLK